MSQFPDPSSPPPQSPLPAAAPPVSAPPVGSPPPPYAYRQVLPLSAMPYTVDARPAKPGVITAIGVTSIVLAGLGFIGGVWRLVALFQLIIMANFPSPTATGVPMTTPLPATMPVAPTSPRKLPPGPPTSPPVEVTVGDSSETPDDDPGVADVPVSPRGFERRDRAVVVKTLGDLRSFSPPRAEELNLLLARCGYDIFPNDGRPLTPGRVESMLESSSSGLTADPTQTPPDVFRTTRGRVELYDDRAVFYPKGGRNVVRVSTLTSGNAALTAAEVERVVGQAQSASGNVMNSAQLTALRVLLTTPGQSYVTRMNVQTAVRSAVSLGDGSVLVVLPNGTATIGPQGQLTGSNGGTATVGPGVAAGAAIIAPPRRAKFEGTAMAVSMITTFAGFALAVYLLVIGILALRGSRGARKLHFIFTALKLPIGIAAAVSVWWLASSFVQALSAAGTGPMTTQNADSALSIGVQQSILAGLGLVYPLTLLIVLQMRSVKEFYNR